MSQSSEPILLFVWEIYKIYGTKTSISRIYHNTVFHTERYVSRDKHWHVLKDKNLIDPKSSKSDVLVEHDLPVGWPDTDGVIAQLKKLMAFLWGLAKSALICRQTWSNFAVIICNLQSNFHCLSIRKCYQEV